MNRRTFVAGVGAGGLGTALAGCLDAGDDPGADENGTDGDAETDGGETANGTETEGADDPPPEPADPPFSIDLRDAPLSDGNEYADLAVDLEESVVAPASPATIEATLTNATEDRIEVSSGAPSPFGVVWLRDADDSAGAVTLWTDAYEESTRAATSGKHVTEVADVAVLEEVAAGESVSRTFELHAETSNLRPGTYEGEIGCGVGPVDGEDGGRVSVDIAIDVEDESGDGVVVTEEPRVDEPPHEIERPDPPDDPGEGDWNEHYLGEAMATEPSLAFEHLSQVSLEGSALSGHEGGGGEAYAVRTVEGGADLETAIDLDGSDADARERLEDVDFESEFVVVVESGYGSGSIEHRWRRTESLEGGVHLHGYYTRPYERTDDIDSWRSVLVVDRPSESEGGLALARASLTVSEDRRVHVNSTEGVVSPED